MKQSERYFRQVKRHIPIGGLRKKEFLCNLQESLAAYAATSALGLRFVPEWGIKLGMSFIAVLIIVKHLASEEARQKFRVTLPAVDDLKGFIKKAKQRY